MMNKDFSLQRKRPRYSPAIAMVVVCAIVSAFWWYPIARDQWLEKKSEASPSWSGSGGAGGPRGQPVSIGVAQQIDVRQTVQAIGTLTALNTAVVRARVDGELKAIKFTEGDVVQPGQLLAQIDPRTYEAQLAQAMGQLAKDAALLKNAELDLQRYKDLLAKDAIARQQVETQEYLVKQLQGTVQTDQAQIDQAKLLVSYTQVTAPISGKLGLKQAELGSLVRSSDANGIVTITQTQPMAVVFAVPEMYVPLIQRKLKSGQSLQVEAWDRDLTQKLATGQVTTTDNAIDVATGTLKLKATLDNKEGLLFPNQFANIRLQLDTLKNALAVPSQAVQRGAVGTFVYVVKPDSSVTTQVIQLDTVDGEWQSIKGEVKAGDRLVVDGADRLRTGSRVEVVKTLTYKIPDVNDGKSISGLNTKGLAGATNAPAIAGKAVSPAGSTASAPSASAPNAQAPAEGGRPPWMDRLPPEMVEKVKAMTPEERKAFFQRMRERRQQQGQ
ncbi:MAG: efflux RND transporter periplasmic adaptor subunit [Limnohabitans sp.]|nr:efflux RND transporter periplasmic adaptor subunit [Limnohabitans sp.]